MKIEDILEIKEELKRLNKRLLAVEKDLKEQIKNGGSDNLVGTRNTGALRRATLDISKMMVNWR